MAPKRNKNAKIFVKRLHDPIVPILFDERLLLAEDSEWAVAFPIVFQVGS